MGRVRPETDKPKMDELEELRRKRAEQLRQAYSRQIHGQELERPHEGARQFAALEDAIKARMTKEALQRYCAVKFAHPESAAHLIITIAQAVRMGRQRGMLGEEQLVAALKAISAREQKNGITIIRK